MLAVAAAAAVTIAPAAMAQGMTSNSPMAIDVNLSPAITTWALPALDTDLLPPEPKLPEDVREKLDHQPPKPDTFHKRYGDDFYFKPDLGPK